MTDAAVHLAIHFLSGTLSDEDREIAAQRLMAQLKQMDEVISVNRVPDPNPPAHNKALMSTLIGLLTVDVSRKNLINLIRFLGDRWGDKQIELEVEENGRKLKILASSREELELAVKIAQSFISEEPKESELPCKK